MSLAHASDEHAPHERAVIVATVLGVLAILAGPGLVSGLTARWQQVPPPPVDAVALTDTAQQVLAEVPDAFQVGSMVVVPASGDPYVAWADGVAAYRVDGDVVDLGVRGLVPYGDLPAAPDRPTWMDGLSAGDAVFSEVGNLWFACIRPPSSTLCHGALLAEHAGQRRVVRSDLGSSASPDVMTKVSGFGSGGELDVWLGWMPDGAATAWATVVGQQSVREIPARSSRPRSVAGSRLWWVRTSDPVSAMSFRDARGRVLARMSVTAEPPG